jgi:hypothetical protein
VKASKSWELFDSDRQTLQMCAKIPVKHSLVLFPIYSVSSLYLLQET